MEDYEGEETKIRVKEGEENGGPMKGGKFKEEWKGIFADANSARCSVFSAFIQKKKSFQLISLSCQQKDLLMK